MSGKQSAEIRRPADFSAAERRHTFEFEVSTLCKSQRVDATGKDVNQI